MPREVVAKRAIEREYHERDDYDRENRVTRQNRKIERPDEACSLKTRCAVMEVISQIGNQEQERDDQRRDLARSMRGDVARPDERVTG